MQSHKIAELFPMMSGDEYAELVKSMKENGYDETAPIVTYEGKILDGRNRWKASKDAGVAPVFVEYDGDDPLAFVIRHNLTRRHLNETQRAGVAAKLANMPRGGAEYRTANLQTDKVSVPLAAELLNVGERTVATYRAVAAAMPELVEKMDSGEMTAHEAHKKVKEQKRNEERREMEKRAEAVPVSERWSVFQADIRSANVDEPLDAIITDPPYPKEYLPLWLDLAKFAKQNLKVGGVLLAMTPAPYLPEILGMLGMHLDYQWILACTLPGAHGSVIKSGVRNVLWKPILVYRNGGDPVNIGSDMFENDKRDKDFHEWGQGVGGYVWQIENFTNPNDLICDPFLGGGTTAVASLMLKRRFVGFDVDAEKVAVTKGRLKDVIV